MHRLLALVIAAAILVPAVPDGALAEERAWLRVASPNFLLYSDAGEARAHALVERLESFRRLLGTAMSGAVTAGEPLVVVAFADDSAMTPFKPIFDGKPSGKSGIFLTASGRGLVLLDASAGGGDFRVVLHEYTHRALALRGGPVPLWLNEGLADLFSTATETAQGGEFGAAVGQHLDLLRAGGALALDDLIEITPESTEYNELRLQGSFYAQAWALAHYLVLGSGPAGALDAFLRRLGQGESQREALRAVFGGTDVLAQEVRGHVLRPGLPRRAVALPAVDAPSIVATPASPAELAAYLGLALVMQRRGKEAAPHLDRAMALAPASSLPYEALGLDALLDDDFARARAMFAEALERDAGSYRSNYYFAHAAMQLDEEAADASIRAALARATKLKPAFPDPYPLLSRLARRDGDYDAAVSWAERGLVVAPNDGAVRLALAHAQVAKRRFADGEMNLRHVAATEENFALRSAARLALRSLESYLAAVRPSAGHARGADPTARLDVPLGVLEEIPEWLHLAPAGIRGRLERLDCVGTSMIARVRVAGRRFTYSTDDAPKVTILTLKHPGVELIDCDRPIDREAIVEFEPDPIDPTAGRLKAIVFLTPKPYTIVMTPERTE